MMMTMKRCLLLFACAAGLLGADPRLFEIRRIYLLPMGSGMDQYLANHLTETGRFTIVTDPLQADAVMTDRIGQNLKDQWRELYPPEKEEDKEKKPETRDNMTPPPTGRFAATARARGNFYLLDRQSRTVVWSLYFRPVNYTPDEMSRAAGHIAKDLAHMASPKKK
jgi:hypothetical protein